MQGQHEYQMYRGYEIDIRKHYNKKLDGWRTYGYYFRNMRYYTLTEVQMAIDEIVDGRNEELFWQNYEETCYE